MKQSLRLSILTSFILIASILFVSATPVITIHSPIQTEYNSTQILLNVTSNEAIDFFIKDLRGIRNLVLAENTSQLDSYLYLNEGEHEFTIWANNSGGETNATISFNTTIHNPVNITDCGILGSSDTEYILINDIITDSYSCLVLPSRNVSLNLNGQTIYSNSGRGALRIFSVDVYVFNGTISNPLGAGFWAGLMELDGIRMNFENLKINGQYGITVWTLNEALFRNVTINATYGFFSGPVTNTHFVNSDFIWNGKTGGSSPPVAFWTEYSEIFLEEVNISGFPESDFNLMLSSDFYLRNTNINMSKVKYPEYAADVRFLRQHKILIDVKDQLNETGSGVVEISDNKLFPNTGRFGGLSNPTSDLLIATDDNGNTQTWLTEKLFLARSSSPAIITEYEFSPYTLTARSWNTNTTVTLNLSSNSTIPVSFQIEVSVQLPTCTIPQMLDLNNDGSVDTKDALIVIRYKTGQDVSFNSTKNCAGINLNPF